jgi:hypothetical protein
MIDYLCVLCVGNGLKSIGLEASFDDEYNWKETRKKAEQVTSTKLI